MAPRSRTGKLMQGLFGRFGKKQPAQPEVFTANSSYNSTRSQTEIDDREFPSSNRFDDDEETNWDDAETLADGNNPIVYAQPIVPVVAPLPIDTTPDLEEWDEALPAATVKNSNIQEVRRSKTRNNPPVTVPQDEDVWDENLPSRNFSNHSGNQPSPAKSSQIVGIASLEENRAISFWTATIQQFRRILPAPARQLSDTILTAMVVLLVTVSIWIIDGLFVPGINSAVVSQPTAVVSNPVGVGTELKGSPEQVFIEAIQGQFSDITSQYSDDIIQTLSVDINRNLLIVQLNPSWYLISDDKQDRVTDRMWLQAKANKFSKLEIQDAQGGSIARSPVVGNHPIILQRRQVN
jgi:preprotein translocase subunit SecE